MPRMDGTRTIAALEERYPDVQDIAMDHGACLASGRTRGRRAVSVSRQVGRRRASRLRVLMVDDDVRIRRGLQRDDELSDDVAAVYEASSRQEALDVDLLLRPDAAVISMDASLRRVALASAPATSSATARPLQHPRLAQEAIRDLDGSRWRWTSPVAGRSGEALTERFGLIVPYLVPAG